MICPVCPATFPVSLLATHMKAVHTRKCFSVFKCKALSCNRPFPSFDSFRKHLPRCSGLPRNIEPSCDNDKSISLEEIINCDNVKVDSEDSGGQMHDQLNFQDVIRAYSDEFVAKLYSKSSIPRNQIQSLVEDVSRFVSKCCDNLQPQVEQALHESNTSQERMEAISKSFVIVKNAMSHLSSEYRRCLYFAKCGALIEPVPHRVGFSNEAKRTADGTIFEKKDNFVHLVPLRKVLKKIMELPDLFSSVQSYIASLDLNNDLLENFMQGSLWKSKICTYSPDAIILPLFLFIDDCQCNNPLGSHVLSLGCCYASLPFLPPECQSAIENIILVLLYQTSFRKKFGDEKVFSALIAELTFLEKEGIVVSTDNGPKTIFFVTGLLTGDNKGLNSVLGFTECFTANFYCRFCKTHRNVMYKQTVEDVNSLRTVESHVKDLSINDVSETGLKYDSVFNQLPSFHVTSNFCVDSFHDLAEGVAHYVLLHVLNHCIPKFFTLETLNNRISLFDFGPCESNKVPQLSSTFMKSDKLKMSGSETLLFVKTLGILVGDLVPENDPFWLLYLKLRQILDICQSKSVPRNDIVALRVLVEEFNEMYVKVTKDTLKAKMHNLVHYCRVLENSGPVSLMSAIRFESKHKAVTVPAHTTTSRVNPTFTFAMRHQLSLCYRFMSNQSILPKMELGPCELIHVMDLEQFDLFERALPKKFVADPVLSANWVKIKGTVYKPGMVLLINANEHGPIFGQVYFILIHEDTVLFIFSYLLNLGYHEHIHAYTVNSSEKWSCIDPKDLFDPFPLFAHSSIRGEKYISLRYRL